MKIVEIEQGSENWLQWRRGLLTATDAAALLGVSPYVTPYKCWQRKLGLIPEQSSNAAMERGKRDEPIARDLFVKEYGINMTPCCVESTVNHFIGASLDGLSDCGQYILEIKSQRHAMEVPELHMCQIQHQFMSTDNTASKAYYVSHWGGVNHVIEVLPNIAWQNEYKAKALDFWNRVVFYDPPALSSKDYRNVENSFVWDDLSLEYRKVVDEIKVLEKKKEELRGKIIEFCNDENCVGAGIKVYKKHSRGRIDYEKLCDELKFDENFLEQFRKKSSDSWVISFDKLNQLDVNG